MGPHDYVRVCPVCDRDNEPARASCVCGAVLSGVDFSLRRSPPAPAATAPPVSVDAAAPASAESARSASPEPAPAATAPTVACPYPDCAQPNPPQRERCVYCNRPLREQAPAAATSRPLPSALRDDYRVVEAFPATGSEADLLLVRHLATGEQCVAKLYRKGLAPDARLLELLAHADGDFLVRLRAHGVSDGVAYEVQEYLRHGTLRQFLATGPLPLTEVRRMVGELADALNGIHAQHILHRDLKPENVLVRSFTPLELALSDFGTASLRQATQHFTGGARTTKYAAPEALTGILDEKADWWALGMIALEAATGRHPFDGLTEQVISHQLATRPIDVRAVYDDWLRALCRGLLLRDPKRRWGGAEVARWLAGDATLAVPDDADGHASSVHPYRIGQIECTTGAELAVALARHWEAGCKDLARGQLARWLEEELHDHNLLRRLSDLAERRGLSDDMRLLRFLRAAAPDLPPVWQGKPVSREALLAAARAATGDDAAAMRWLDAIATEQVLEVFAESGHDDLREIDRRWRDGWSRFLDLWKSARSTEAASRTQARAVGGVESAQVANVDELLYSAPMWQAPPRRERINGPMLLALLDTAYADALGRALVGAQAEVAGFCRWFDTLQETAGLDPVAALVAQTMLPQARDDAEMERRRQGATQGARERVIGEARAELRAQLAELRRIAADDKHLGAEIVARLLAALGDLQQTCERTMGLGYAEPDYLTLARGAEKLSVHALAAQEALARCEQVQGVNAIFLQPQRALIAAVVVVGVVALRVPWMILALTLVAASLMGYRWYVGAMVRHRARAALRWLQLHAKTIEPAD